MNQDIKIPYITPSSTTCRDDAAIPKSFCRTHGSSGSCVDPTEPPQWVGSPPGGASSTATPTRRTTTSTTTRRFRTCRSIPPATTVGSRRSWATGWSVSRHGSRIPRSSSLSSPPPTDSRRPPISIRSLTRRSFPGDRDYEATVAAASVRLQTYHNGYRYGFCPPDYTEDIIDPLIQSEVELNQDVQPDLGVLSPTDPTALIMPTLTPLRPNYISFDDTDPPGPWIPRRPDWADGARQSGRRRVHHARDHGRQPHFGRRGGSAERRRGARVGDPDRRRQDRPHDAGAVRSLGHHGSWLQFHRHPDGEHASWVRANRSG